MFLNLRRKATNIESFGQHQTSKSRATTTTRGGKQVKSSAASAAATNTITRNPTNILAKLMLATKKVCNTLSTGSRLEARRRHLAVRRSSSGSCLRARANQLRRQTSLNIYPDGPGVSAGNRRDKSGNILERSVSLNWRQQQQQQASTKKRAPRSLSRQSIKPIGVGASSKVAAAGTGQPQVDSLSLFKLAARKGKPTTGGKQATTLLQRFSDGGQRHGRARWLHTFLFIVINGLLLSSLQQQPQVAFGAPLVLYGLPRATPGAAPVSSVWLSDGLLTVDPASDEPEDRQLVAQDADSFPVSQDRPASLNSLVFSEYNVAAGEQQPSQFVQVKPRRNWLSLQAEPTGDEQQQIEYNDNNNDNVNVNVNEQAPQEEALWIQRRRLNRDRALEPPAWLRERPIRRDDGVDLGPDELELETNQIETTNEQVAQEREDPSYKPIKSRTIRGRQLRQSNELYNEILRHLIEEALDSRDFLEDLYNELQSRLSKSSSSTANGKPNVLASLGDSGRPMKAANARLIAAIEDEGQVVAGKGASQQLGGGDDPGTLVVVNDEVSEINNDDFSPLSADQANQQASSERLLDSMLGGSEQNQRQEQLTLQKQLAELIARRAAAGSQQTDQQRPFNSKLNLLEVLQSNLSPNQQNDQFHVVEDIDQLQDQSSQPTAQTGGVLLDDKQQQQQQQQQLMEEFQASTGDFEESDRQDSGLQKRDLRNLFDSPVDDSAADQNESQDEFNDEDQLLVVPVRKSAAFSRQPTLWGARKQNPMRSTPAPSQRRFSSAPTKSNTNTNNNSNSSQLMNLAIKLIQSNYFSRRQLIHFGNKVKSYVESAINVPRDSIVGLFPVNPQQLLVDLDQSRLSARDRFHLMQNFNYNRASVLVDWPQGSQQNPVPILKAILAALMEDANNNNTSNNYSDTDESADTLLGARQEQSLAKQRAAGRQLLVALPPVLMALSAGPDERQSLYNLAPSTDHLTMDDQDENEGVDSVPYGLGGPSQFEGSFQERWQLASTAAEPENDGRQVAALLAYLGAIRGQQEPLVSEAALLQRQNQQQQHDADRNYPFYVHLGVILLALVGSYIIVRLFMRRLDKQVLRTRISRARGSLRSLWSNSASDSGDDDPSVQSKNVLSSSALVVGEKGKHLKELEAGNFGRRLSADSGLDTIAGEDGTCSGKSPKSGLDASRRHLDQLSHRLMTMLSFNSGAKLDQEDEPVVEKAQKADLESQAGAPVGTEQTNKPFRSSTSYIKSLIDALTRPRCDTTTASSNNRDDVDDDDNSGPQLIDGQKVAPSKEKQQVEEAAGGGIIVSQMDISAAHLILDYMEKHLDDKERLRREWLELNAMGHQNQNQNQLQQQQQQNVKSKANQLVLQRLAKVGLQEENRNKNRNPNVVPFDRNRVCLRAGSNSINYNNGSKQTNNANSNKQAPKLKKRPTQQTSDYINASFIYDDDPRSPTHIIAQGPTEQTIGQFWQMIWEQEVSVIVMLTRLNENGQQMCHCYWPTGNGQGGEQAALGSPKQAVDQAEPARSPGGRRGSVTSVFSAGVLNNARQVNTGGPIIAANDELADNVLYFRLGSSPSVDEQARGQSPPIDEETPALSDNETDQTKATNTNKVAPMRLEVHLISEHVTSGDYLVRNMYLINRSTGETRTISQFHYLAWPELKTPENVRSLLQFRRLVLKSYRNLRSPILVHCSDGAGRSGTYTLLDLILERIRNGAKEIDPRATLEHLRDQRVGLCATQSQFEFVLVALAEEIQIILNALPK